MRVLEFYSGIGGTHLALSKAAEELGMDVEVAAAFDIHPVANHVYRANFTNTKVIQVSSDAERVMIPILPSVSITNGT